MNNHAKPKSKEVIPTQNPQNTLSLDLNSIPDHIRDDIGMMLFRKFQQNIRDPEKRQLYRALGMAFLERKARRAAEEGGQT